MTQSQSHDSKQCEDTLANFVGWPYHVLHDPTLARQVAHTGRYTVL